MCRGPDHVPGHPFGRVWSSEWRCVVEPVSDRCASTYSRTFSCTQAASLWGEAGESNDSYKDSIPTGGTRRLRFSAARGGQAAASANLVALRFIYRQGRARGVPWTWDQPMLDAYGYHQAQAAHDSRYFWESWQSRWVIYSGNLPAGNAD